MFLFSIKKNPLKKNDCFILGTVFTWVPDYNIVVKVFFFCTRLKNGVGKESRVGLISAPSSGNTWTRYLLEKASGYFTGCAYNDTQLYSKGILYKASK